MASVRAPESLGFQDLPSCHYQPHFTSDKVDATINHHRESSPETDHVEKKRSTAEALNSRRSTKRKGRRKSDGLLGSLCRLIVQHQIGLAANLLTLLAMTHMSFPRARHHTRKFFALSYYNPETANYALGYDDLFFVGFWIVVITGLRAAVMDYLLAPLAQVIGLSKKKEKTRFAEQAWVLIYDSIFWSLGMYIMYKSDYWLNTRELWTNWPNREMGSVCKWYYLVQYAFWVQQIVVVHIEERRKDHWQMFTHHIITCSLIFASYGYHQTKVGNTILCLMDVVDLLLPLAKILKYLQFQTACDITFGAFMLVWFVARHVLYGMVCYSVYAEIPKEITYGCYWGSNANLQGPIEVPDDVDHLLQPFRDPEGLVCWDNTIKWGFLTALLALQVILCIWFVMIIRVAMKVLRGGEAEDSRSDDEDSDEDAGMEDDDAEEEGTRHGQNELQRYSEIRPIEVPPVEEELGGDSMNMIPRKSSHNRKYRKVGSTASGVHLPSDRKELLGRIGCDKG
ncbi:MAG: hypothetical protein L6R37_006307 [Teloschistes peruensis]|nr:MAG: hypothetical protein L6R37_006307 [Teloschistes peruensis]